MFLSYKWFMSQKHLCGVKHECTLVNLRASAHSRIIDFWILNISVFRQLFFSRAQIIIAGWGNKLETYNSTGLSAPYAFTSLHILSPDAVDNYCIMEAANQANLVLQLPRFKFDGKNQQEFCRNWPQVARHYHIQGIIDGTEARPIGGDDVAKAQA